MAKTAINRVPVPVQPQLEVHPRLFWENYLKLVLDKFFCSREKVEEPASFRVFFFLAETAINRVPVPVHVSLIGLVGWLVGWFADWFADWLVGW